MNARPGVRGERGFTLVELLVVLAIITFVAALTSLLGPVLKAKETAVRLGEVPALADLGVALARVADQVERLTAEVRQTLAPAVGGGGDPSPEVLAGLPQELLEQEAMLASLRRDVPARLEGTTGREQRRLLRQARRDVTELREAMQKLAFLFGALLADGRDPDDPGRAE
jgi:prepilin-type N-terminal cleavage/methylation domain-containing protein